MRRKFYGFILGLISIVTILSTLPSEASAATYTIPSTHDIGIYADGLFDDADYSNLLQVGYAPEPEIGAINIALKFDLSSVTGTVVDAKLSLFIDGVDDPDSVTFLNIYGATDDDWDEGLTKFPVHDPGTDFIVTKNGFDDINDTRVEIDVTSSFIKQQAEGDDIATLVLTGVDSHSRHAFIYFFGRGEPGKEPQLLITSGSPPTGSVSINNGSTTTNNQAVSLSVTGSNAGSEAMEMRFSNDNTTWSTWEAYATTKSWSLASTDGTKTVYMQLRTASVLTFDTNDNIVLDTTRPIVTGVTNGELINVNKTITFNEGTATLNGAVFTSGTTVSVDGSYTLIVTDAAGNVTNVAFTIDKAAPIVTGVTNGDLYNVNRTITFNEGTATLNGSAFTSGSTASTEGSNTLVVTDAAGNVTTVIFTIDKTAPVVTGVTDGGAYSVDKIITFSDGTATLNGAVFTSGTTVGEEDSYTLVVTDTAGNVTNVAFTIDKTDPIVTGVNDGDLYNVNKTITFNEGTATLNGAAFTSGTIVSAEGIYILVVTDAAGNATTMTFTIDKSAPIVTGVADGGAYNTDKSITFSDGTATLNGAPFTNGSTVSAEGSYTLVVTNAVGNATTVAFTIDKTNPIVTGVTNGNLYNVNKTITFDEGTAILNGAAFTSGTTVSVEGTYTLVVTDAAGNVITVLFTIDKTAPIVTGVTDGGAYNVDKSITFSDGTATLNGAPFTTGSTVSVEGSYTLEVTDTAGNVTTVTFTIDKTAPIVTGVTNGDLYNVNKTITFDEGTATLNGAAFTSGTTVSVDGTYTLVVTDAAGNATTVPFTIDKTAPIVTGVTDGSYNTNKTIAFNEGTATLNGSEFNSGTTVSAADTYTLIVTDAAGNVTIVAFTIDKTAPIVTGVTEGSLYNENTTITFDEGTATLNGAAFTSGTTVSVDETYTLVVADAAGNVTTVLFAIDKTAPIVSGVTDGSYNVDKTITFNEGTATLNGSVFTSGTTVSAADTYTLVVTDAAGNVTTVTFTIDKTNPIITGVTDGGAYSVDKIITFSDGTATLNGAVFTSGTTVSEEDSYTLVVADAAGNVTTVLFAIDKTAPIVSGVTDGSYNVDKTITFNEGTATLNGVAFTSGTTVSVEGSYTLVVTDAAGNATTVTFTIDKSAPIVTGVTDGGAYNVDKSITFSDGTATLNGAPFTNGSTVSEEGSYTLVVTNAAGNVTTVTFTIDKTAPVVTGVTAGGLYNENKTITFDEGTATLNGAAFTSGSAASTEGSNTLVVTDAAGNVTTVAFTIDKTAPIVSGVTDGSYNANKTITFNEGTATLSGAAFTSGTTVSVEGSYTLVVTDTAGNVTTVTFTIDKTNPIVTGVTNGDLYNVNKTITFIEGTATLNGAAFTSGTTVSVEGNYTLVVTDAVGNVTTVAFTIDKTAPIVTGVTDGGAYNVDKSITFSDGTATLNGAPFTTGSTVSVARSYTLEVTDTAGNVTSVTFTIDKTAPVVTGVTAGGLYNENKTITFDEGTATLNGAAFTSGSAASTEGSNTLVVTDAAGNVTTVAFTIDKTAPIVSGVTDGSYNANKTITFNEGTATLNGAAFTSGTTVSVEGSYTLVVTDTAGNVTTVTFTIDKTNPIVTGVTNGDLYNVNKTITFIEGTATLNGAAFTSGTTVSVEGNYTLVVTDAVGNVTTVTFTIDKTAPIVTGVTDGGAYNVDKMITFNEGTATLNGAAFTSGTTVSVEGSYALVVTDTAGNVTTVTFTIDKIAPIVTGVTDGDLYNVNKTITFNEGTATLNLAAFTSGTTVSVDGSYTLVVTDAAGNATTVTFTIDKTAPIVSGVTDGSYNVDKTITFNEGTATLNGSAFTSGTTVSVEGSYTLVVTDTAGNVTTVIFTIDKTAPIVTGVEDSQIYTNDVTVIFNEGTATLNGSIITSGTIVSVDDEYSLVVTDAASNSTSMLFEINQLAPVGTVNINASSTSTTNPNVTLTITFDDGVEMRLSNDGLIWSDWENTASSKVWTLSSGIGVKTVYLQLKDTHGNQSTSYTDTITLQSTSSGGGGDSGGGSSSGSGSGGGSPANNNNKIEVKIILNGVDDNSATAAETTNNGKKVITVTIDEQTMVLKLDNEKNASVVSIPVNAETDVVVGELNGFLMSKMSDKNSIVEVTTKDATYHLPAKEMQLDRIAEQFGIDKNKDLRDMKIQISIANLAEAESKVIEDQANQGGFTIIAPSIEFKVTAVYGDQEIEVTQFNSYVERTIAIPDGVDPTKITTGVVIQPDGTFLHVPTKIIMKDGKYYAVINSLTNSIYSVIYNEKAFNDMEGHWAEKDVNSVASRLIISGESEVQFAPNRTITRAEFTVVIVKAMGLSGDYKSDLFQDVKSTDWYADTIAAGKAYGLIGGSDAHTFNPNATISRQEAMVIVANAMALAGMNTEISQSGVTERLSAFEDRVQIADWARRAAALSQQFGIIQGAEGQARPTDSLTRAEAAAIINRLLEKADLI